MKKHIYLTGFMGVGKTSVGRRLAELIGRTFVDLDAEIEAGQNRTVAEIFAAVGEEGFRKLESAALRAIDDSQGKVIATGGGILNDPENRRWIRAHGTSVWLDLPFEIVVQRLGREDRRSRPLFENEARARQLFHRRRRQYGDSDLRIAVLSTDSAERVAESIRDLLTERRCDT